MARLSEAREQEKRALDAAWNSEPKSCGRLLERLTQAHERYLSFAEVAEKALPLLQTLARTESLRREAVEHLDRLEEQSRESRRLRAGLARSEIERISSIPETVGERFDLSLLSEDQLRLIAEARAALGAPTSGQGDAVLETFSPGAHSAPEAASTPPGRAMSASPGPESAPAPASAPRAPAEDEAILLEDLEAAGTPRAAPAPLAGPAHGPGPMPGPTPTASPAPGSSDPGKADVEHQEPPPGLSDDDALDAMFEEALAANRDLPAEGGPLADLAAAEDVELPDGLPDLRGSGPPHPTAPPQEPAAPRGSDPLDELLSRAGFEG